MWYSEGEEIMIISQNSIDVMSTSFTQFENWANFVDTCIAYPYYGASRRVDYSRNPWAGTATWEEAVQYAQYGNPSATEALQSNVDRVMSLMATAEVPEMYLDVTTDYGWDMGTAITGNPQAGINFQASSGESRKQVRLVLSGNNLARVSANEMFYRGSLAYCLYLTLARQNYDVSVDLVFCNRGLRASSAVVHTTRVNLVSSGEILDLAVIAHACTSPSVFRRLYFAYMETCWNERSKIQFSVGSGYGATIEAPETMQGDIYLSPGIVGNLNIESDYLALIAHAEQLINDFQARG